MADRLTRAGLRRFAVAGRTALDLLLPPSCIGCDKPVDAQGLLCPECFRRTGFITPPLCDMCGLPFEAGAQAGSSGVCVRCEASPPAFQRARAALRYDAGARRLILPLKHADRTELATALAPMMARAGASLLREADLLVPVPLHRTRLFHRRYNQAALLALAVGRLAHRPVQPDALQRTRRTASLGALSATERHAAVADAFRVRPRRATAIAGARVLLIDGVMTSGATAEACARALTASGARAVCVLAAARVPHPGD